MGLFWLSSVASGFAVAWVVSRRAARRVEIGTAPDGFVGLASVLTGVVAGSLLASSFPERLGVLLFGAVAAAMAVAVLGTRRRGIVVAAVVGASALAAGAGIGTHLVEGAGGNDLVATALLATGAAALAATGPGDGVVTRLAALVATGVVFVALLEEAEGLAAVAGATLGASGAFAIRRSQRDRPDLGTAARVFLGLTVAGLALHGGRLVPEGDRVAVSGLLLLVPLLDGVSRVCSAALGHARARRGPHVVDRLVERGVPFRGARTAVTTVQAFAVMLAALVTAELLRPRVGAVVGAVLVTLVVLAGAFPVRRRRPAGDRLPRWARAGLAVLVGGGLAFVAPAAFALLTAAGTVDGAIEDVQLGLAATTQGDRYLAVAHFASASTKFEAAEARLGGWWPSLGLHVPAVGPNLRAARTLSTIGGRLSRAGERLASAVNPEDLEVIGGVLPLDEIAALSDALGPTAEEIGDALVAVRRLPRRGMLPPLRDAVELVEERLTEASASTNRAIAVTRLTPAMLGAGGPRRYFVAIQDNAEARATGGVMTGFAELVFDGGQMTLTRLGRTRELNAGGDPEARRLVAPPEYVRRYGAHDIEHTWQNVNLSPDFPTVGGVISHLYPQSGGQPVDGVIGIDPAGLAAVMKVIGSVRVPSWPEPIGPENVVAVVESEAYVGFEDKPERLDFLADVGFAVMQELTEARLGNPQEFVRSLSQAIDEKHLMLVLTRPDEQTLADDLGASGAVAPLRSDALMVVTQNIGANKLDYHLRRRVRYAVDLVPGGDRAQADARLEITLANDAPSSGLPSYVIGPNTKGVGAGENVMLLSVYTPLDLVSATLDREPVSARPEPELGRRVYTFFVRIAPGGTAVLRLDLAGFVDLVDGRSYELELGRQPLIAPDDVEVSIGMPPGWEPAEVEGLEVSRPPLSGAIVLATDHTVRVRLEREP